MNYKLDELNENNITDFLLNPLQKAGYYNGCLLQKYPVSEMVDSVICLDEDDLTFKKICYVLYEKKEIMVTYHKMKEEYFITDKMRDSKRYIIMGAIVTPLILGIHKKISKIEKEKLEEADSNPEYIDAINQFKDKHFQLVVNEVLGGEKVYFENIPYSIDDIDRFVKEMADETLIECYLGNEAVIDKYINDIVCSKEFIINFIVYPKVREKAKEYIDAGGLTEHEIMLKEYNAKTKTSNGASYNVQIETITGEVIECYSEVTATGYLKSCKSFPSNDVHLKDVKKAIRDGVVLYEKE